MSNPTPESIAERKARARMAFLALPPEAAQRMISFNLTEPLKILSDPDLDLSFGLEQNSFLDERWTSEDLAEIYERLTAAGVEFVPARAICG